MIESENPLPARDIPLILPVDGIYLEFQAKVGMRFVPDGESIRSFFYAPPESFSLESVESDAESTIDA